MHFCPRNCSSPVPGEALTATPPFGIFPFLLQFCSLPFSFPPSCLLFWKTNFGTAVLWKKGNKLCNIVDFLLNQTQGKAKSLFIPNRSAQNLGGCAEFRAPGDMGRELDDLTELFQPKQFHGFDPARHWNLRARTTEIILTLKV